MLREKIMGSGDVAMESLAACLCQSEIVKQSIDAIYILLSIQVAGSQ